MTTGFANGVFYPFHLGHDHFLRECKMNCDKLIIAMNSTPYVYQLKGVDVPPEAQRMALVAPYADGITFFDSEQDLLLLMQAHKPDVIFKGEDYIGKPITGGDLARIHWVARHPGYSSTIERAKASRQPAANVYGGQMLNEDGRVMSSWDAIDLSRNPNMWQQK